MSNDENNYKLEPTEILTTEGILEQSRAELIAANPELAEGETVYKENAAILALDVERFSTIQAESPELAIELTEFVTQFRDILIEHGLNCGYEKFYFLKSAGDELMFMQEYPNNDQYSFLRTTLFLVETQIIYNKLLATERYKNVREYYEKLATEEEETRKVTSYVQPGVFLPSIDNPYQLMLSIAKSAKHGEEMSELLVAGQAASAKYLARRWSKDAEVGTAIEGGNVHSAKLMASIKDANETIYERVINIPENCDDLTLPELEDFRKNIYEALVKLKAMHKPKPMRTLTEKEKDVVVKLNSAVEKNKRGELIYENGGVAFVNIKGLDQIRNNLSEKFEELGVSKQVLSQITMEIQQHCFDIINDCVTSLNEKENTWELAEAEYMVKRVGQIEGDRDNVSIDTSEGSLVFKLAKGITNEGGPVATKDLEMFSEVIAKLKTSIKSIVELTQDALDKEGIIAAINMDEIFDGVDIDIGIGLAELSRRNNVFAYYRTPTIVGGNASSLAARALYAKTAKHGSFISMPGYMMAKAYEANIGSITVEHEILKGYKDFKNQVLIDF